VRALPEHILARLTGTELRPQQHGHELDATGFDEAKPLADEVVRDAAPRLIVWWVGDDGLHALGNLKFVQETALVALANIVVELAHVDIAGVDPVAALKKRA
jgi:hypothetical protein